MSDQTPSSQYPQNPYQGDPQGRTQSQQGYPPAGEPYPPSVPPTAYAQPYAGSSSPYPSMPNQPGYRTPSPYAPYPGVGIPLNQPQPGNGLAIARLVLGNITLFTILFKFFRLP